MLQSTGGFRFMDLPPEIRMMIYECMIPSIGFLKISTHKRVNEPRRPLVLQSIWDRPIQKWTDQPSFALTFLRASKQTLQEAAPLLYSNNEFRFSCLGDMKVFLDRIGSMRPHVRHISIDENGYQRTKARSAFHSLKDASNLRTFSFHHSNLQKPHNWFARKSVAPEIFVLQIDTLLKCLRKAHQNSGK